MPVFEAIKNNDLSCLHAYLSGGGNPDLVDEYGNGLIHLAICDGKLATAEVLLRHGASPSLEDGFGNLPLHVACIYGEWEAARLLVGFGAEMDATSEKRPWTPLMIALNERHIHLANWLIEMGANTDFVEEEEGWTPFLVACENGLKEVSLEMIKKGAHLDAAIRAGDIAGRSAIHLVAYHGEVDLIKVLVEEGVDVNAKPIGGGLSALHWAVYNDHQPLVDFLLEVGADPNMPAAGIYDDRTPLHYAVTCKRGHMLPGLLRHEADPLQPDIQGRTALDIAWQFYREGSKGIYRDMLVLLEDFA